MSIIYTSHYMEEVELLCNKVAIVDQGKIIAMDTIKNLIGLLGGGVIQVGLQVVDEALLEALKALPTVNDVSLATAPAPPPQAEGEEPPDTEPSAPTADELVKIEAKNSQETLVEVFSFFNERDIPVTSVTILEPNLESVFLHLTGKKLRE
jgi:ABC-2 type transport system ATP-binding protein